MFCTHLGTDSWHTSSYATVQGYKKEFRSSTALMPPLMKALGGNYKTLPDHFVPWCSLLTLGYLLFGNTATYGKLSFRVRGKPIQTIKNI